MIMRCPSIEVYSNARSNKLLPMTHLLTLKVQHQHGI